MVIDSVILEMADDYQPIGTIYERLMRNVHCDFESFGAVCFRICRLIQQELLEYKFVELAGGGYYVVYRRNRRHAIR